MPPRTRQSQDNSQLASASVGSTPTATTAAPEQEHVSATKGYKAFLITERDGQCTYVLQPIPRPFGPNRPPPGSTMGDAVESVMRRLDWSFENEPTMETFDGTEYRAEVSPGSHPIRVRVQYIDLSRNHRVQSQHSPRDFLQCPHSVRVLDILQNSYTLTQHIV